MLRWWGIGLGTCGIVAACSSFSGGEAAPAAADDAGTVDGAPADVGTIPPAEDAGADAAPRAVHSCPPTFNAAPGAKEATLATTSGLQEYPFQIATDATSVFWAAQPYSLAGDAYNGHAPGRIHRVAKTATNATPDTLVDDESQIMSVAVDGDYVYWATYDGAMTQLKRTRRDCVAPCGIEPLPVAALADGPVERLFVPAPGVIAYAVQDGSFYRFVVDSDVAPRQIVPTQTAESPWAVADDRFYYVVTGSSEIHVAEGLAEGLENTAPFGSLPDLAFAGHLATDCNSVWSYGRDDGFLYTVGKGGGMFSPAFDGGLSSVFDIALDVGHVYVAQSNAGGVFSFDRTTGAPKTIHTGSVWALAVDNDGVYWGEHTNADGAISGTMFMLRN